ncbi:MAG TPA: 2-amino-4-hydroxy-6-hydroxymethyldihydropteridine diphosphokinase [Steroidobacteraceae bacterium]|nr:2-amino-4-hydroxy-6-hydroxymethyldihydropteridine diphosphokinase [Steroidobacteraceae bacterium]
MTDAHVAAGSNVRPRSSLAHALALLEREFPGLRASRAYSNPAVGFTGDDFVNLVVAFPADIPTADLLERLKSVERACGREPGAPKWGPRTLDLDLLLHGESVGRVAGKTLPHPDLLTRAWVLGPLAELAPGLVHPVAGETIATLWSRFDRRAHPLTPVALEAQEA